jgi:hypothetical protein
MSFKSSNELSLSSLIELVVFLLFTSFTLSY